MKKNRIWLLVLIFSVPLILILSQCINLKDKPDARGAIYAGSIQCRQCHQAIYDGYLKTAHYQSTRAADIHTIHGSFAKGSNEFTFYNGTKVVMEKRDSGLYQAAYLNNKLIAAHRFDITFGGIKAESYLYWNGDMTYQLPLSYFNNLHAWTNSPGYDTARVDYTRIIGKRCFECHSSYVKDLPGANQSLNQEEHLDRNSLILSIDCERCHGPGTNHVNFHLAYPDAKKDKYMVSYKTLTRQQKMDVCAVCHSGNKGLILRTTFAFKPGDTLANFKEPDFFPQPKNPPTLDVHGNQNQMLATSQCYIQSKMDCATCHNTHVNERGNLAMYSQKCMDCHTEAKHNFCKLAPQLGAAIKNNCIDCHMPAKPSTVIAVQTSGKGRANPYMVRTHHIAVYPEETQKIKTYLHTITN